MRSSSRLLLCAVLAAFAACKANPNSIKDQGGILKDKGASAKEKLKAVENLRKIGKIETVPALVAGLKTSPPKVKAEIAVALAELKDTSAMMPLAEAIELEAKPDADTANQKIAQALGDLGGKGAVPALLKLYAVTTNPYVKYDVLTALGRLGGDQAVPLLVGLAVDKAADAPLNKKAMTALSMIAPPEALPVFIKGLVFERGTVTVYPDASFGLFRLREKAWDAVLAILTKKDKATYDWAKEEKVPAGALVLKAADIEGALRDPRAVPVLIKLLKYTDENEALNATVPVKAQQSLGLMRAKAAIPALSEVLKTDGRDAAVLALTRIGDRATLPKLIACASNGDWNSREPCIQGVAAMGGKAEVKLFDGYLKDEPKKFMAECKAGAYGEGIECEKERDRVVEMRTTNLKGYKAALEVVAKCEDTKCIAAALSEKDPVAREKAAYTLLQKNDLETLPALLGAVKLPVKNGADMYARQAAVIAIDWMVGTNADARTKCKGDLNGLQAVVDQDSKIGANAESADTVKRLIDVIEHGREPQAAAPAADDAAAPPSDDSDDKPKKPVKKKGGKKGK